MFKKWERMESHRCRYFYIKSNLCISLGSTVKCLIYYRAAISINEQFLQTCWTVYFTVFQLLFYIPGAISKKQKQIFPNTTQSDAIPNSKWYECDLSIKSLDGWLFTQQTRIDTKMKMSNLIVSISIVIFLKGARGKSCEIIHPTL